MPTLSRFFIKTGLSYLLLALASGLLIALSDGFFLPVEIQTLRPVYFHLFMVGWVTHLIFGVAWWMFPPRSQANPRGREFPFWICYGCLNAGLILRAVAEPLNALGHGSHWGLLLVFSSILQVSAGWIFVFLLWPRIKGRKE